MNEEDIFIIHKIVKKLNFLKSGFSGSAGLDRQNDLDIEKKQLKINEIKLITQLAF